MEKKILFLKARTGMDDPSPPMAFGFLGAIAKKKGFEVLVENLNAQYNEKTNQDIVELIKKEKPEIVGVHIFTNAARDSYELIKAIRPYSKLIISGGPHSTARPKEILERGADIAFIGEAEISFEKFLDAYIKNKDYKKVKGIMYKKNGKIVQTEPEESVMFLDSLPFPDKEVNRKSDYIRIKDEINNLGQVLSTRGCPGRCTYCFSLFNKCYRYMSAKKVFEEIEFLHKKYGITIINFIDDAFTINKQRMIELCDILIEKKLPIKWTCATRVDFLDEELIAKMKKAGCSMINFGIESAIPNTLLKMKKTSNPKWYVEQADKLLKACYKHNIRVGVNILTGFPWETPEDMRYMQKYIDRIKKYVTSGFYGGILQPQPGTDMYEEYAKKYGFEEWWIHKRGVFRDNSYRPFFTVYYHQYWDHLKNNFYKFDKPIIKEIDKLYRQMGKWNLYIFTRRRFKNLFSVLLVYYGVFALSNFSYMLYKISPGLERALMGRIKKFSYRFKFRKGEKKLNE
ncbi:MAG: B12-binding domain-containing radical SAM protein [Candidatus Nanoarchaeia archaeon]